MTVAKGPSVLIIISYCFAVQFFFYLSDHIRQEQATLFSAIKEKTLVKVTALKSSKIFGSSGKISSD